MWPMVLDYTKDECQRMLRKLELEAYAAVVSAFRAQGELTKDKKKTLQELSNILCISLERHRAEIRRAVNDERLNTIAERIVGPNTSSNWAIEGRRLVPLMPRLVPQTAFSALANNVANSVANAQAAKGATSAPTASIITAALEKELLHVTGNGPSAATASCSGLNGPTMSSRPLQAAAVVPPSAAWTPPTTPGSVPKVPSPVVLKTEPTSPDVSQAEEDNAMRKRKRSLSLDSLPMPAAGNATASLAMPTSASITAPVRTVAAATPVATPATATPAPASVATPLARVTSNGPVVTKVVVPTSLPGSGVSPSVTTKVVNLPSASTTQLRVPTAPPQKTTTVPACSQKVILVSTTAAPSPMSSNLPHPPLNVPVVKTVSAPGTTPVMHQGKAPMVMGLQTSTASHPSSPAALTSVTSIVTTPVPSASVSVTTEPGVVRLRPRAVTVNPRVPLRVPRVPTPVPPSMGGGAPQLPCPSPSYGKATISVPKGAIMQYRQEGTVKIIAQSQLPISGAKLVTKAGPGSTIATSSSSSSSTSTSLNAAPRVSTVSITSNQTRVVNVITASQPGVVRTLSRTVTPGTSGLNQRPNPSGLRPTLGSGAKPNVIVVHKAQVWPQPQPGMASASSSHINRSTDSVTYLQRQDRPKTTVGACGTVTVVKTSVPIPQPCIAPVVRMSRETTVKTVPRLSIPVRKPPEQLSDASSSSSSGGSASASANIGINNNNNNNNNTNNNSSLLAELMQAAGILQGEGDSGQPPPLLVIGEDAVPPAEVEVAIDTVPVDDNAVILDDGQLLADSEAVDVAETTQGVVVEEAPCLLQDHVVCDEVELVAQPGLQLEVVSTSPLTESSHAQPSQNGQIATKEPEPASHKVLPSTSSSAEQPKLKSAAVDGTLPTSAPENHTERPHSPHRKRPGTDDGKDVPGASNGLVASGVAERLRLMVSDATAIPISSTSTLQATDTAQAQRPATDSPAIVATLPAPPVSSAPLKEASNALRRTDNSDLAIPGPSKVSTIGSTWKHSMKPPLPGPSTTAEQQQPNGPRQSIVNTKPEPPVGICEAPSTSNGPSRILPSAAIVGSLSENSNVDRSDSQTSRQASIHLGTSSNGNGGPSQSSTEEIAEDSAENSVENLVENSDDNTNDSSQGSSSMVGGDTNEDDSVGPTDLQDSISSSSSAALVYPRNPDEEQSAIISSSSNDHSRREAHKAKRACDVSSSTSVSASPCPVAPMPSTSAIFGEQRLPVASSTPSAPEQNSPDQTSEGSSTAHFELPSCFGEGNGGSSSNVTSAELEIALVSSPTPDAQELSGNSVSGERSVAGSEERSSSAVESSEQEGPVEVSSAIATQQPGPSLLHAQREEVTSAQHSNGLSSAASSEVTSAVSCPNFDNDDDDIDGNEAGPLVSELVVSSDDEEVSTAEAVLVHSEGLAEITCSTVDATSASTASGSLFHLDTRPLSVSSTEEAECLGGSVEVDSHEDVPDAQAFSDVGTSSSCGNRGEAMGTEAAVGTVPPAPDEASSDSHSGVESSRTVSTACDSGAPAAGGHGTPNGTSDQPSQSETGGGFSAASAVEEPVESGNNAGEVYELLICDSEASEGITSVMVDSVSSTVFGAQRGAGPSPSTYHLVSLPSCSSSGPSTSRSPPTIDVASLVAYHRTEDVVHLDASSSSSPLSSSNGQPVVADSSASLPSHDSTSALNSVPGSTSSSSQPLHVDNGSTSNNGSGSSSSSGTSSDPATPQNVDDSETYENGTASASSSACGVILVGAHAAGTSSEIVVCAEEEATASVTVTLDNCNDDSSSNAALEGIPSNLLTVSSSAPGHSPGGLVNGVPDERASTSRLVLNQDEDSAASSAISDIDTVVGNVVTVETLRDVVEQVVTSSASVTPVSLSQPSTSRGTTAGPRLVLKRKRRVNTLIDESLCASGHVSGWARVASGLLDRVCKFRGANRSKGVPPPAHWFLEPVDPEDAPGYYDVIDQPMDFSTIKKKLESGQYRDITEFHEDMMLVKRNCQTYNPPDHEASQDCEEVFAFYLQEYNRLVEKWQKSHLLSSPKRSKLS